MSVTDIPFRDISIPFSFKVLLSHNLERSFICYKSGQSFTAKPTVRLKTNKDHLVNMVLWQSTQLDHSCSTKCYPEPILITVSFGAILKYTNVQSIYMWCVKVWVLCMWYVKQTLPRILAMATIACSDLPHYSTTCASITLFD